MKSFPRVAAISTLAVVLGSCMSLDYDLGDVPVPILAQPEPATSTAEVVPFEIRARNQLYVHGLFGGSEPDVAALVTEAAAGYDRVTSFRVVQSGNFHHWLLTHLSLTLWRMKSVVISGELVRDS